MSELKAITAYDAYWKATSNGDNSIPVYLKSEADKVIADLKAENEKLNAQFYPLYEELKRVKDENESLKKTLQHSEDELESYFIFEKEIKQELRHNKYKRCLAMAKWCESEAYIHEHGSEYDEDLVIWFRKWHKRWLELAEKFKPNK